MEVFRQKLAAFARSDFGVALAVVIVWQLALATFGVVADHVMAGSQNPVVPWLAHPLSLLGHTEHWDADWMLSIAQNFYHNNIQSAVFYPLFPFLVKVIHAATLSKLSFLSAGLLINITASWLALVALIRIARQLLDDQKLTWLVSLVFLSFPSAVFMHFFYSEAVFCALGFWAYLFALRRQWMRSGLALMLLTASRVTSITFILLCVLEYCRAYGWSPRKLFNPRIAWFLISPLGWLAYAAYLHHLFGDPLAMIHSEKYWDVLKFDPNFLGTLFRSMRSFGYIVTGHAPLDNGAFSNIILPILALTAILGASVYALVRIRKWGIPLGIFGLVSLIMFTLNSSTISVHRYALPVLTIYLALGYFLKRHASYWRYITGSVIVIMAMTQVLLLILFAEDYFAG